MSTLEKAIDLLQTLPENKIETVYTFLQFIKFQDETTETKQQLCFWYRPSIRKP